jgi:hypothetical protein
VRFFPGQAEVPVATRAELSLVKDVLLERRRQDSRWGTLENRTVEGGHAPSALSWLAILGEEFGEVSKDVLERGPGLRDELVQVAAVALAFAESLDRDLLA